MKQNTWVNTAKKWAGQPVVVVVFLAISVHGCSSTKIGGAAVANYDQNPLTVAVPPGVSSDNVAKAMIETLIGRKWTVQSSSSSEVIGTLKHRAFDAKVTLQSDGSIITILNDSTHRNSNTGEIKPGVPLGWLIKIQADLQSKLLSSAY